MQLYLSVLVTDGALKLLQTRGFGCKWNAAAMFRHVQCVHGTHAHLARLASGHFKIKHTFGTRASFASPAAAVLVVCA
jgi:hypothetical protein